MWLNAFDLKTCVIDVAPSPISTIPTTGLCCRPSSALGGLAWHRPALLFSHSEFSTTAKPLTRREVMTWRMQALPCLPSSPLPLCELLRRARILPILIDGDENAKITGIQHDSRLVKPGDVFVCCQGFSTDGHVHAPQAALNGAVAIVGTQRMVMAGVSITYVQVEDTNAVLSALSASFYEHPSEKLTVVGVTGTNGKTTTTYLVKSVFEAMRMKTGLLGTIAYDINDGNSIVASNTTPDALCLQHLMAAMVRNNAKACVMEVSSHALALGRCNAVDFDIALFTNLTRDHMDFHGTEQNYKESKGLLFAKMLDPCQHRKVVNADDPHASYFVRQGNPTVPVVTFSLDSAEADVYASRVGLSLFKTDVVVQTRTGQINITSKLLGRHNVYNILAAVAVGMAAGIPPDIIRRGVEAVHVVPGRCELIQEGQNFAVLVDFAHTPDALARLLDTVNERGAKRVITVIGCGGERDRGKRPIMGRIASDKSDICILTSDNPRNESPFSIIDGMLAGMGLSMEEYLMQETKEGHYPLTHARMLIVCENRRLAIRKAISMGKDGDAVVIAGKGHEPYQIVGNKTEHFDDREECRRVLRNLLASSVDCQ